MYNLLPFLSLFDNYVRPFFLSLPLDPLASDDLLDVVHLREVLQTCHVGQLLQVLEQDPGQLLDPRHGCE